MNHLARCTYQRFQLATRHMRLQDVGGWASSLNHASFERSIHVLRGLLHVEGYHLDDICEFARENRMNVYMRSNPSAPLQAVSSRDLLVAFDFGHFQPKPELRCLWIGAVKPDTSRLRPLYRYVCNIKMKLDALSSDVRSYQTVEDQIHTIARSTAVVPAAAISVSNRSPLFIDEASVSNSLQMNIFRRDKQMGALLEKLRG